MKLFFDPIKDEPAAELLDGAVATDLRLEDLLHEFLHDRDGEQAAFRVLNEFCSDVKTILYRQQIIGDLMQNQSLFDAFSELRASLWEMRILYGLKMFREIPEMAAMKTFLVIERFHEIYTCFENRLRGLDLPALSPETQKIAAAVCSEENCAEMQAVYQDLKGLRESLETIGEIRINRFFSRGQNVENSILEKTKDISFTRHLANTAAALGLDVEISKESALLGSKELSRPVFRALYRLYRPIFENINAFHEKYSGYFDEHWFDLIFKLDAALAFAKIFRQLGERGFACAAAVPAKTTVLKDFYSLFLPVRGLTPEQVVCNDLTTGETVSFFFITGPNAGGKTIFLSALGLSQLLFQACGFIPARAGEMKVMKRLFTHFPVEEYNENSGRLVEEQDRVESIFRHVADGQTLALFNETYSSTKADIAYEYSVKLCEAVVKHNVSGLFVTHLHSLKDYAAGTGSIGVLTALHDAKTGGRLYKIVPVSDQNSSYARDILEKYDMTVEQMLERLKAKSAAREGL